MSELRNAIDYDSPHGYRSFELWQGDITDPGVSVDVLVVSYLEGFEPVEASVVTALHKQHGINIFALARNCEYDLRQALGTWVSFPLQEGYPFRRIIGVEMTSTVEASPSIAIDNVFATFALLEAKVKGIEVSKRNEVIRTLALPVLGAGGMAFDPNCVLDALIPTAKSAVERSPTLERVVFVAYNAKMANLLDAVMNTKLGRGHVKLLAKQKSILCDLCSDIVEAIRAGKHLVDTRHGPLFCELENVLHRDEIRSFEIGILGRRLAEMIVDDIVASNDEAPVKKMPLTKSIEALGRQGVSGWITSYLHVLRSLGNESAHEAHVGKSTPPFVNEEDLVIGLFCIRRLLAFWVDAKVNASNEQPPRGESRPRLPVRRPFDFKAASCRNCDEILLLLQCTETGTGFLCCCCFDHDTAQLLAQVHSSILYSLFVLCFSGCQMQVIFRLRCAHGIPVGASCEEGSSKGKPLLNQKRVLRSPVIKLL